MTRRRNAKPVIGKRWQTPDEALVWVREHLPRRGVLGDAFNVGRMRLQREKNHQTVPLPLLAALHQDLKLGDRAAGWHFA